MIHREDEKGRETMEGEVVAGDRPWGRVGCGGASERGDSAGM